MRRSVAALAVSCLLAACDGNPLVAPEEPVVDPVVDPVDGEEPVELTGNGIPVTVARNLQQIVYDPVAKTLLVTISGLDGTPGAVSYQRNTAAERGLPPGYEAYTLQEDPLDRFFTGLVKQSFDGTVRGGVVSDGGQFNRFFSGGYYERDGGFTPPTIGDGPGQGQVTYAGDYVGLDNFSGPRPPLPDGTDPSIQPEAPGRVTGKVVINANFSDMQLNGSIFNRLLLDNPGLVALDTLVLAVTDIDAEGNFSGAVERNTIDAQGAPVIEGVGNYAGLFGGADARSIGAVIFIENYLDDFAEEAETGVFVLTQCGQPGADATLCNGAL